MSKLLKIHERLFKSPDVKKTKPSSSIPISDVKYKCDQLIFFNSRRSTSYKPIIQSQQTRYIEQYNDHGQHIRHIMFA